MRRCLAAAGPTNRLTDSRWLFAGMNMRINSTSFRVAVCSALVVAIWMYRSDPRALLTIEQQVALEREAQEVGKRFDAPDEALAFYVNKRTGPIITRGNDTTRGIRTLDSSAYLPALEQMRGMPRFSTATRTVLPSHHEDPGLMAAPGGALGAWQSLGPANQGGRTRALLVDPNDPNLMYAGGVAGGVWKSTDAGASWTTTTDLQMPNIAIASLVFDPLNSSIIYAGTGEGMFNSDAVRGAGVFRSTDAGLTWTQLASTTTADFHYVNGLAVSPRNTQRIFAATRTGLYRTTDGGTSWTQLVSATSVNGCTQVALQQLGATGYVFASCGNFAQGTIYRADDDDTSTFSSVLSNAGQGRSAIAIAPSLESTVYVMAASTTTGGTGIHGLHAVYRSTSNGDPGSFTTQTNGKGTGTTVSDRLGRALLTNPVYAFLADCGFGSTAFFNQGWYDNVIAVDPVDPNRVWAGGIDLFRSDNGGATWGLAGYWWFSKGDPNYHHADQHGIVFHPQYDGTTNKVMFSASDGGVERIDDARAVTHTSLAAICGTPTAGAAPWTDRNAGYVTTQFYDGAAYPNGATYFGGLQDNGTQRGSTASPAWSILTGGDGGYTAVNTLGDAVPTNDVLFTEFTGLSLQRSLNGGSSFATATAGITGDSGFLFIAPFAMNQGFKQHLWMGGWYVWRTTNQATSWVRASAITAGNGSISAVAAHPLDPNRVLVGTSDGYIHWNTAALSATSATVWPNTRPSSGYISGLTWDPANVNVAYATVSTFAGTTLLKSTNGGQTWAPSVGTGTTALPAIPAHSVVVSPDDSQQVYVGTDLGVFTSVDGGASWYVENTGFSNTVVESLEINETAPHYLYGFTHGRGAWRVTTSGGPTAPIAADDAYGTDMDTPLTVPTAGVLGNDNGNGGGAMTAVLEAGPTQGSVSLASDGSFTFTPAPGFWGAMTFSYRALNSSGLSNIATATVRVGDYLLMAPAPLRAVDDRFSVARNTTLAIPGPGLLANDTVSSSFAPVVTSPPKRGRLSLRADGGLRYTPARGFSGTDSFKYRLTDGRSRSEAATVTLLVTRRVP